MSEKMWLDKSTGIAYVRRVGISQDSLWTKPPRFQLFLRNAGKLTNGWSFRHCFRSSARRGLQIPDIVEKKWCA